MIEVLCPSDATPEENMFIELVKKHMLQKLNDRQKFIFLYIFEMGHANTEAAEVIGIDKSAITRHVKNIRLRLSNYNQE